jgi:hypothetical protein
VQVLSYPAVEDLEHAISPKPEMGKTDAKKDKGKEAIDKVFYYLFV